MQYRPLLYILVFLKYFFCFSYSSRIPSLSPTYSHFWDSDVSICLVNMLRSTNLVICLNLERVSWEKILSWLVASEGTSAVAWGLSEPSPEGHQKRAWPKLLDFHSVSGGFSLHPHLCIKVGNVLIQWVLILGPWTSVVLVDCQASVPGALKCRSNRTSPLGHLLSVFQMNLL